MPATEVYVFQDDDGNVSFWQWLDEIEKSNRKIYDKCRSYVRRLQENGHELRRPTTDFLRDGIYELRFSFLGVNYRILYGFVGENIVLISHGITKKKKVPPVEINKAIENILKYKKNPEKHRVKYDG